MEKEDKNIKHGGQKLITVFTPTYNRKNMLSKLYDSLKKQTDKDFEWFIVDDGSKDGTEKLIQEYKKENRINIRYFYQENGGKQRAVNRGVKEAEGEYFFIVDSDDYLSEDAVEMIKKYGASLPKDFGGMVFKKINLKDENYKSIENYKNIKFSQEILDTNPIDIIYKYHQYGDKGEIFKTEILKKYPFPEIEGEKFVPEGYIWNRIGKSYNLRYIDYGIYFFEYLEDGYTKNFKRDLKKNPKGFGLYYRDMLSYNIPFSAKIKFFLRYIQTKIYAV